MTSSSDDSLPLLRRQVAQDIREKKKEANRILLGDSSDSSLPSWLEEQNATRQSEGGAVTSRVGKKSMIFIDSDDSDDNLQMPKEEKKPPVKAEEDVKAQEPSTVLLNTSSIQQASQTTVTNNKSKQETLKSIVNSNSATIVVPDKLPMEKMIFELESNDGIAGTTDLSGDSGVIGRMLLRKISTDNGVKESMELDLKGSIYNMTPVQFPGTIMVMNFTGGSEAKVEGITNMFIQLREDKRFANDEYAENLKQWLDDDDDDDDTIPKKGGTTDPSSNKKPRGAKQPAKKKPSGGVRKKPAATIRKPGAGRGRKK